MPAGRNGYSCFTDAEFSRRHAAARSLMDAERVDALLMFGNRASHHEIQHLTNFAVSFEAALFFPARGDAALWVNYANHQATARAMSVIDDVRWGGDDLAATVAAELALRGLDSKRVGVAGPLSHARWTALSRRCPHLELVDVQATMARERLVKSDEEVEWARRGAALTDLALEALRREVRPGLTDHDLAAIVQSAYYASGGRTHIHYLGSTSMAEPALCAPAQVQTGRRLSAGDIVLTELSAAHHGWWGQALRCFAVAAEPTATYARMHETGVAAFIAICDVLRDGATSEEVLAAAEIIDEAGFTIYDDLVHMANGGVYAPYLRTRQTSERSAPPFEFRENMLVVVQPNVVARDLRSGIQVGELVRITASGVERLHHVPLELFRCG